MTNGIIPYSKRKIKGFCKILEIFFIFSQKPKCRTKTHPFLWEQVCL